MKCNCENVDIGSHQRQIWLHAPAHMPKDNGYCIDLCIAQEITGLWMAGITTTGCCCGHNKAEGFIGVVEYDIEKMKFLGYQECDHPEGHKGYFLPKYDKLI